MERFKRFFLKEQTPTDFTLTKYQTERILNFSLDNQSTPLSIFNGFLTEEEKKILWEKIDVFLRQGHVLRIKNNSQDLIPEIVEILSLPPFLAKKLKEYCQLNILSEPDIEKITEKNESLPLPVLLVLGTMGKGTKNQFKEFLNRGGIMTVFSFKKPPDFYLKAVEDLLSEESLQEKVSLVLSGKANGNLEEASHQFIVVDFISQEKVDEKDIPYNPCHLRKIINRRLDNNYEKKYATLVLMEELLKGHMDEVKITLLAMSGLAGFFYFLDQFTKGKISEELYYGFQALVKLTTHLLANLIDFYSQYKLFLKGENIFIQLKDLVKKFSWREGFIFANGGFIDLLSEFTGMIDPFLGSVVFGTEPMIGTSLTTLAGSYKTKKEGNFIERIKILIENPAVVGMNIAAFLTLLTSIGLLGIGGQFHNPLVVVLVGGMSEPICACLMTELITKGRLNNLRNKLL